MTSETNQFNSLQPVPPQEAVPGLANHEHFLAAEYWDVHAAGIRAAGNFLNDGSFTPEVAILGNYMIAAAAQNSEQRAIAAEANARATHDKLTGLMNIDGLTEALDSVDKNETLSVLYVDLTNFKAINDLISHKKGDTMLVEAADILRKSIREGDFAARIGGDEFLVILRNITQGNHRRRNSLPVSERGEMARERIETLTVDVLKKHADAKQHGFDIAIGVSQSSPGDTIAALKDKAETEMKKHKAEQHEEHGQHRKPKS